MNGLVFYDCLNFRSLYIVLRQEYTLFSVCFCLVGFVHEHWRPVNPIKTTPQSLSTVGNIATWRESASTALTLTRLRLVSLTHQFVDCGHHLASLSNLTHCSGAIYATQSRHSFALPDHPSKPALRKPIVQTQAQNACASLNSLSCAVGYLPDLGTPAGPLGVSIRLSSPPLWRRA